MIEDLLVQGLGPLGPTNFLKHAIVAAVNAGVNRETIVILLLFPLAVALIAAARYLVGLKGFGIFTPAMLAVAFLATGISEGLVIFFLILVAATLARMMIRRLKMHYLARMSLLLWFICLAVFGGLFWLRISIFPILILILLAENFIEVQVGKSLKEAAWLTIETFVLALGTYFFLQWQWLQKTVLVQPEAVVLGTAVFNLFLGRFTGLRLLEHLRFKRLLK